MNSYPPELLAQLAPIMFVGGLDPPQAAGKTQDPFAVLSDRLRETLLNQRKVAIWQPEKNKTFQVVIVDKVCTFAAYAIVSNRDGIRTFGSPLANLYPQTTLSITTRTHRCLH